jgi:membrane protein DedA with SNARE-associated domain
MGFEHFIAFFEDHHVAAYAALFLVMLVEGESFLILAGVLANMGALNFSNVILISFVGVLVGDFLWYAFGFFLRREGLPGFVARIIRFAERVVGKLYPRFDERPLSTLMIAKFVYGTNRPTLILSGFKRLSLRIFATAEIAASAAWVLLFATLGYFMGYAAVQITHRISLALLLVLISIAAVLSFQRFLSFYYENKGDRV